MVSVDRSGGGVQERGGCGVLVAIRSCSSDGLEATDMGEAAGTMPRADNFRRTAGDPLMGAGDPWLKRRQREGHDRLDSRDGEHANATSRPECSPVGQADPQRTGGGTGKQIAAEARGDGWQNDSRPVAAGRECSRCKRRHNVGTFDFLRKNDWHCKSCSFEVLEEYKDKSLARHVKWCTI